MSQPLPSPRDAPPAGPAYLSIRELAAHTGVSVSTLRRLLKAGRIAAVQPGGPRTRLLFRPDALDQNPTQPPGAALPAPAPQAPPRGPRPRWLG
jgi:excisionase family DNA binding protein